MTGSAEQTSAPLPIARRPPAAAPVTEKRNGRSIGYRWRIRDDIDPTDGPVRVLAELYVAHSAWDKVFARITAAAEWSEQHGQFDCLRRSHAWRAEIGVRDEQPTAQCRPTTLSTDLRCEHHREACSCVGELVYRGACLHCAWEGPLRGGHSSAVEDAHDHAWPGWRDLPCVPRRPDPAGSPAKQKTALARWADTVNALYPHGWLAAGGPIRTQRRQHGTRHVPDHTGFGGDDLAVPPAAASDEAEP